MELNSTWIEDTFAEAFDMHWTRLVVTAAEMDWLNLAAGSLCGYGTSILGCDAELGVECDVSGERTPDGRQGRSVLLFSLSADRLGKAVMNRVAQCVLTCATTAVFDGLPDEGRRLALGKKIRFFGDGFQKSKLLDGRRYWRIPVLDGEFVCADTVGCGKGVAGGNLIVQGTDADGTLRAARRGVAAIAEMPGVITPFPGGLARSGSKVGSRYRRLAASTNEAFCPTLRGRVATRLVQGAQGAVEIVINGVDARHVARAMGLAMRSIAGADVLAISAGNFGGKLGRHHLRLHDALQAAVDG